MSDVERFISGDEIRMLRKEAGYTQQQLADKVELHVRTINSIENNKPETIKSLSLEKAREIYTVCRSKVSESRKESFMNMINNYLFK